jgi:hypothetical protein
VEAAPTVVLTWSPSPAPFRNLRFSDIHQRWVVPGRALLGRYRGRLAAVVAAAIIIIIAAIVIPLSLDGAGSPQPQWWSASCHRGGQGERFRCQAAARATARQDACGSWDITLTVQHLESFGDKQWYECWYISQKFGQVASAGSFQVPASGNRTFHMTSAADPRDFPLMEITLGPPSSNGAKHGTVVLSSQTL